MRNTQFAYSLTYADWHLLRNPAKFGMPKWALRGVCKTKEEFFKHCKELVILDNI